ncbi:hypothetical protein PoB_007712300 [Plakobranchus ocellatus]|uniref:Uncharacterized protein n=1 Tax=Plakobranchus ocellatus TaxID=259542 RepID=A0AAV4E2W6_9GAST|nr:hypothetical protein PoB_007712300 [Plakobranchus ocellatus]
MASIPQIVLEERGGSTSTSISGQQMPPGESTKNGRLASEEDSITSSEDKGVGHFEEEDHANEGRYQGLPCGHVPIRSSSDIGLPGTSMPNLALTLMAGGGGGGQETYIGVYCSPRASRRSVDLEVINSRQEGREDNPSHYDWSSQYDSIDFGSPSVNTITSASTGNNNSCNTLRVLTSSSRAASALSLTSDCTARSIGLLSNDGDSDSDADASLMSDAGGGSQGQGQPQLRDGAVVKAGTAQLRRYLSHPEESVATPGSASEVGHARPSMSLINIKSVEASLANPVDDSRLGSGKAVSGPTSLPHSATIELDDSTACDVPVSEVSKSAARTTDTASHSPAPVNSIKDKVDSAAPEKLTAKPPKAAPAACSASYSSGETFNTIPQSLQDGSLHKRTRRADAEERIQFSCGGSRLGSEGERSGQKILSYKCDAHDTSRNGRIRQWLQDMDKVDLSTG